MIIEIINCMSSIGLFPFDFFFVVFSLLSLLLGLLTLILTIWVIYDTLVVQEEMDIIEKLIWIIASFIIPVIIPIIYYIIVKRNDKYLFDERGSRILSSETRYDKLEKLHELKEKDIITEEEFEREKEKLIP